LNYQHYIDNTPAGECPHRFWSQRLSEFEGHYTLPEAIDMRTFLHQYIEDRQKALGIEPKTTRNTRVPVTPSRAIEKPVIPVAVMRPPHQEIVVDVVAQQKRREQKARRESRPVTAKPSARAAAKAAKQEAICRVYQEGYSYSQIYAELHVDGHAIREALKAAGIPVRPQGKTMHVTDEEIFEKFRDGWTNRRVCSEMRAGVQRVAQLRRAFNGGAVQ